ncbi:hypothetical protein BK133_10985 [Paenibacillus sp. FSL H8-0548]|uniref:hypothetical protein n=1 Tax=Paenibacillus sp. FSL H8-0548 TaxID=1920422 RepID=UPI000970067E|nr:hypothetical protein [Paenibacillus sp. FSL H8-0548]OMF35229.1 hypothetical protein BK133_10985 [Paenibacillus sp. FSL H8-0548]
MIDQIKHDYAIVTCGEHARNLAEVEYRVEAERKMTGYVSYLLDELEKERRGKEVALSSHKYLEGELEKALFAIDVQKNATKFCVNDLVNASDELDMLKESTKKLRAEHTAMKEALEFYSHHQTYVKLDVNNFEFAYIERDEGEKARSVLSTLTKEAPTDG